MRIITRKITHSILVAFVMLLIMGSAQIVVAASPTGAIDTACAQLSAEQKAANPACAATDDDPVNGPNGIVMTIANLIAWFAGAIAVIVIIFAGFRFTKSSGDSAKVQQARETILYALVGLVVIVLARFIIGLVISKL